MRTNCILWALRLYWRRRKAGKEGYLVLRRSRWGPFPHVLYGEMRLGGNLRLVSYKPSSPLARRVPPAMFRGAATWGD